MIFLRHHRGLTAYGDNALFQAEPFRIGPGIADIQTTDEYKINAFATAEFRCAEKTVPSPGSHISRTYENIRRAWLKRAPFSSLDPIVSGDYRVADFSAGICAEAKNIL